MASLKVYQHGGDAERHGSQISLSEIITRSPVPSNLLDLPSTLQEDDFDDVENLQQSSLGHRGHRTPLPILQLAILCAVRLAEPIA